MDAVKESHWIKRCAQWVLRKELEQSRKSYLRVQRESDNNALAYQEAMKRRLNDQSRICELRAWFNHTLASSDEQRVMNFVLDYAGWTEENRKYNTNCVHPASRWGIRSFFK